MIPKLKQCEVLTEENGVKYCGLMFAKEQCKEEDYTKCPVRDYSIEQQDQRPLRRNL